MFGSEACAVAGAVEDELVGSVGETVEGAVAEDRIAEGVMVPLSLSVWFVVAAARGPATKEGTAWWFDPLRAGAPGRADRRATPARRNVGKVLQSQDVGIMWVIRVKRCFPRAG